MKTTKIVNYQYEKNFNNLREKKAFSHQYKIQKPRKEMSNKPDHTI